MATLTEREKIVTGFTGRAIKTTEYVLTFDSGCVWTASNKEVLEKKLAEVNAR